MFVELNIQMVWYDLSTLEFSLVYISHMNHLKQFDKSFLTKKVKHLA